MSDLAISAISASLDGLAAQERIIAQNLANADTPGYTAGQVNFEDSLRSAIAKGDPTKTSITTTPSTDPANVDGNNVSVDEQSVSLTGTALQYQLMTSAMNNELHILHESMRSDL
ncbi:MAG TPA: flagellar basal body protein [Acidimicrobiia bacterium]|jgi:flagellar basal-body rod protein FlgB